MYKVEWAQNEGHRLFQFGSIALDPICTPQALMNYFLVVMIFISISKSSSLAISSLEETYVRTLHRLASLLRFVASITNLNIAHTKKF